MGSFEPAGYYDWCYNKRIKKETAEGRKPLPPDFIWEWIASQVDAKARILELGSGCGELSEKLTCTSYLGIDFSRVGCGRARSNQTDPNYTFLCGTLPHVLDDLFYAYDTVISCETLEHFYEDIETLDRLHSGAKLIVTLPTFDRDGHVRCFPQKNDVIKRYQELVDFESWAPAWPKNWGFVGRVK